MEDHIPKSMTLKERDSAAWKLFRAGEHVRALSISEDLVLKGYKPAYMLVGVINEYGGRGVMINLPRAIDCYRQLVFSIPSDVSYIYLARAHLKIGAPEDLSRAKVYLANAGKFRKSGSLYLAMGAYHESKHDWLLSARYNIQALLYGRLLGMRRAADALSQAGYVPIAWLLRGLQLVIGLPLRLMIGKRAIEDF